MSDYLALFRPLIERGKALHFAYHLAEQRVVYVSRAYEQVVGDPVEHVNEDLPLWLARVHPDDRNYLQQRLSEVRPGELVEDVELRVAELSGGLQWLCVSVWQAQSAAGEPLLCGSVQDITGVKEATINSHKFNTKKNATLEILSHDLAAPLVLMQQLTEHLAQESKANPNADVQKLLRLMERTCTEGVNLIRDFVDHEFLESANVEMNWERADLGPWLATLVEEYQRSEQHMHLHFIFLAPDYPVYVNYDINKFQQVVNNLISNAIKFTPDGGRILLGLEQQDDWAVVTVADTGVGIPAPLQPGLFEKFTRSRRPGLRGEKSTGLGMSVIKTIVGLHHGRIRFGSEEGQGTTFFIELPALPASLNEE
jgi:two-component system sensor histidine kinase VicK